MSHFYNSYVAAPVAAAPGPAPMRAHRAPSPTDDAIVQQVEWYMGRPNLHHDDYLKHKMDDDLWVSLDVILAFPKMMRIGVTDKRRVASLLHARSTVVEVDEANCRIRPYWARRSALLLHDVPHLTRYEQVMLLFQHDNSNSNSSSSSTASANIASNNSNSPHPKQPPPPSLIQPISDTSWIVNFDSPTAAQIFLPLIAEKSINGQKIVVELVPDVLRSPQAAAVHDPFRQSSQPAPLYPRPIASATPAGTPLTPHDHLHLSVSAAPPFAPHPAALSSPMLSPMPLPMPVLHPHHPADMHPPPFAPAYNPNGGTPPPPVPHSAPPPPPPGAYTYAPASMPMPRPPFLGARTMPPTPAYIIPYQTPPHFDPSAAVAAVAAAHVPMQAAQMQSHNPNHSHGLPHGHNHNHHISPHPLAHHPTPTHHSHSNVLPHPQSPILHQATHGLIAHSSPAPAVANDVGGSGVGGNGALTVSGSTNGSVSGGGGGVSGAVGSGGTESTDNETYNNARASISSSSTSDPSSSGNNGTTNQSQGQNNSSTSIGSVAEQLKDVNIKGDVSSRSPDSLVSFPTDSISNGDMTSRVNSSGKLSMTGAGVPTPEDRLSTPSISNASIDVPTTPRQSESSRFNPQRNSDGPQSAPHSAPLTPHMNGMGYSRPQLGNQSITHSNSHHSHMSHHGSGHNHSHNHGHSRHHYHNYHHSSNHYGGANGNHGGNGSNGGYGNGMYGGGRDRHHGRNGTNFDGGMRYNNHYNHHHHNYHNHHHNNHYNHGHHGHHNHGHHGQHHINNGNHNGNSSHNSGPNHTPHTHQHHPHGHHHHHHGGMQGRGPGSSFDGNNRGFNGQSYHRKGKKGNRGQHNHGRHPNHDRFGSDPRMRNNHHHHLNNHPNTNNNTSANGNGSNNINMSVNGMNNRNESTTPSRSQSPNTRVEHNAALTSAQQAHQNTNFSTPPNHSTNSNLPEQSNSRDDSRVTTNPNPKDEPNLATMNFPPLGVNANSNTRNSTSMPVKKSDANANTLKDADNDVSLESNVASSPLPPSSQIKKGALENAKVPDAGSTASAAVVEQSEEDKDVKTSSVGAKNGSNQSSPPAPICKDSDGSQAGKNVMPAASNGSAKEAKGGDAGSEGPARKHSERRTDSNSCGMSYAAILRSNKPTPAPARQAGKNGTFTRAGGSTKAPASNVTGSERPAQVGSNASSETQSNAGKVDNGEAGSLSTTPGGDGKEASDKPEKGSSGERDGVDDGKDINHLSMEASNQCKDGASDGGGGGGVTTGSTVSAAVSAVETTVETANGEAASNNGSSEADAESARSNFVWANKPKSVFEAVNEVKT